MKVLETFHDESVTTSQDTSFGQSTYSQFGRSHTTESTVTAKPWDIVNHQHCEDTLYIRDLTSTPSFRKALRIPVLEFTGDDYTAAKNNRSASTCSYNKSIGITLN